MKSWDEVWEKVFKTQEWGKYPSEDLIRFVARNFYKEPRRDQIRILDIGCGAGAASWYMAREGFSVCGIDGAETAIRIAIDRLKKEGLKGEFKVGDITEIEYPDEAFHAVVDVCAIQHNSRKNIDRIIAEIYRVLRSGGKLFSMMTAVNSYGYRMGKEIEKNTFTDLIEGPSRGKGIIHFFERAEIENLMKCFSSITIERVDRTVNNQRDTISQFIVTAAKQPSSSGVACSLDPKASQSSA